MSDTVARVEPIINTIASEPLRNSLCKKLFQSPGIFSRNGAHTCQSDTASTPGSSDGTPDVIKVNESSSSAKLTPPSMPHQNPTASFRTPQTVPHRKFSFGKHRELELSNGVASPTGSKIISRQKGSSKPIYNALNTPGGVNTSAFMSECSSMCAGSGATNFSSSTSGQSIVTQPVHKASFLVHPQPKSKNFGK